MFFKFSLVMELIVGDGILWTPPGLCYQSSHSHTNTHSKPRGFFPSFAFFFFTNKWIKQLTFTFCLKYLLLYIEDFQDLTASMQIWSVNVLLLFTLRI